MIGPPGRASVDLIGADPRFASLGGPLLRESQRHGAWLQRSDRAARPDRRRDRSGRPALAPGTLGHASAGPARSPRAVRPRPIELQIGVHVVRTILGTTLNEGNAGALVNSQVALAPIAYAQRVAGLRGRVTRVFVQVRAWRARPRPGLASKGWRRRGISTWSPPALTRSCSRSPRRRPSRARASSPRSARSSDSCLRWARCW